MLKSSNILVTGGAGTLGHAIARRRRKAGWTGGLTVYSTDSHKHEAMRREFPDVNFVQGDIRNVETLYNAMVGHDIVIHAAAVKIIPVSEVYSLDTIDVNVMGSQVVCEASIRANIKHVIGISTDKACHPANAYGATKYLMEKMFQEYSRSCPTTQFHLVRYGNVLESNGSVVAAWKRAAELGEEVKVTDPEMTRFWLSPAQAVDCIIEGLELPNGWIYIPRMPALSIGKMLEYCVGKDYPKLGYIPVRPGEKKHETLLTEEEAWYAREGGDCIFLAPTVTEKHEFSIGAFSSDMAGELTEKQLNDLLVDVDAND